MHMTRGNGVPEREIAKQSDEEVFENQTRILWGCAKFQSKDAQKTARQITSSF
jgi:hypothetical protein